MMGNPEAGENLFLLEKINQEVDEYGIPGFYKAYQYRKDLRSAGFVQNLGGPLFQVLLENPVKKENVEFLLTRYDSKGNYLLDFNVYLRSAGHNNIIAALLAANIKKPGLKPIWLQYILDLRQPSGKIVIDITAPDVLQPLIAKASLLGESYVEILTEACLKQQRDTQRLHDAETIFSIINKGRFADLECLLADKDEQGVPYAYSYYRNTYDLTLKGPIDHAINAARVDLPILKALLAVRDNNGNPLYWGIHNAPASAKPFVIQAAELGSRVTFSTLMGEKKADNTRAFDINETFAAQTAVDIFKNKGDSTFSRLIEEGGGFQYQVLHGWSLEIPKVTPPSSAKDAVSKIREAQKLKLVSEIKEENRQVLAMSINPIQQAAFDAFARRIEVLLSDDTRTLRSMNLEIHTLLGKFWDFDSLVMECKSDFHFANKEISALSDQIYNDYIAGQDTDTLTVKFLEKLAEIKGMVDYSQRVRSDSALVFLATADASSSQRASALQEADDYAIKLNQSI